ncbi:hypothetical protein AB0E62_00250 [Streptomyces sp. NPDC038707]|uniref:hypothetical protein n=1 Tax=Streptomyces sp. NPDC038707 TaxID=3154329 RepID=UPI0033D6DE3B
MSRYEIREREATDLQRGMGFPERYFEIWDLEKDRRVPFAVYRTREDAQRRIDRGAAR